MPPPKPPVLDSKLDWLNEWANNPKNGADIPHIEQLLIKYQNRPIRKNASAKWQDSTTGTVIPAPPASECIWEWKDNNWLLITACPSGETCDKPKDNSPMPPGTQLTKPCHN